MAEKDMTEKSLEAHNDVFADIANVLLFQGKQIIAEQELEDESPRSIYKTDGKLHEQERDTVKYWRNGAIRIALLGLENETAPDADMPLRVFGYDGAAYRAQLLEDNHKSTKEKQGKHKRKNTAARYPVITLVLYFGYKRHWNQPQTLHERLKIPEKLKPFVNDFRINLFEIAYLSDEQVKSFRSDFRYVADYFVQMRRGQDFRPSQEIIRHVHEFLQLMAAITGDHRYEEIYVPEMERRGASVCELLDKVENRGIQKGIRRGEVIGAERIAGRMISRGRSDDEIHEDTELPYERIRELRSERQCD